MEGGKMEAKILQKGKEYERKLLLWISLSCIASKNIRDFWLISNPKSVGKFDDIILHVQLKSGQKEVYFVQVKHKENDKRAFVVMSLEGNKQNLKKYQNDFLEIWNGKTPFLERFEIDKETTRMLFVLAFRQKLHPGERDSNSSNLKLILSEMPDFLKFSCKPSNCSYKLEDLEETSKYDSEFLEHFRIILDSFKDDNMEEIICQTFGLNIKQTETFINYMVKIFEPSKYIDKVNGIDVKMKLMDILYDNMEPPEMCNNYINGKVALELMNSFEICKIHRQESKDVVWQAIWSKLKEHCPNQYVTKENWNKSLPLTSDEYESITKSQLLKKELNLKDIYFLLCIRSIIPFYLETYYDCSHNFMNHIVFKMFSSIIIYDPKNHLHSDDHQTASDNVLTSLNDLNEEQLGKLKRHIMVSFQGKAKTDLIPIVSDDPKAKAKIDTDLLLKVITSEVKIGKGIRNDKIYVARKVKVPVMIQDVLKKYDLTEDKDCVVIFCNLPDEYVRCIPNVKPLEVSFSNTEENEHFMLLPDNIKGCNMFFWPDEFDAMLSKEIIKYKKSTRNNCYVLEYKNKDDLNDSSFVVKYSDGEKNAVEGWMTHSDKDDKNLLESCKNSKVNIICNSAGMGKTHLLRYLSHMFPLDNCAVYVDIHNYSHIGNIRNSNDLRHFFFGCLKDTTPEIFHDILEVLHELYDRKRKFIWLIDDYEEMHTNSPVLLDLLKNVSDEGVTLWLASRTSLKLELESKFKTLAMEIRDFDEKDVFRYFELSFADSDPITIRKNLQLASAALKHSVIGNCQKTMMLADIFKSNAEIKLDSENEIYRRFIENEIERYDKNFRKIIHRTLSKLALYHLFPQETLKKILYWKEFNEDVNFFRKQSKKSKIVSDVKEDCTTIFNHKTYAEYLAANWLAEKVQEQIKEETSFNLKGLIEKLYLKELTTVRSFFDSMILDSTLNIYKPMKDWRHDVFQNALIARSSDVLGRSILQVIMSYCQHETYNTDTISQFSQIKHKHCSINRNTNKIVIHVPINHICNSEFMKSLDFRILLEQTNKPLDNKDLMFGYNTIEYAHVSGSLCYVNALLEVFGGPLPEVSEDRTYFIFVHSIVYDFTHILQRLDISRLNCFVVKVNEPMESLLHLAIQYENEKAVQMLLAVEDNLDRWGVDKENNTVLHALFLKDYVRSWSREKIVDQIFSTTYTVELLNQQNSEGFTVLHYLCRKGLVKYVKHIVQQPGIEIDAVNIYGDTPFKICVKSKKFNIAKRLRTKGADVNHRNKNKMTILHYSVLRGDLDMCKFLVGQGANIGAKSNFGITPLMLAAGRNHRRILDFFLSKKPKVNKVDVEKRSALHHAINNKSDKIVEILLKNGADVNRCTKNNQYPVMMACKLRLVEILKMLLDRKPTCGLKEAYKIAQENNYTECMSIIRLFY